MSLAEDPQRPRAGRDHILCGTFKKRPLGGTGHIRVLAHFPKGQKIIRCTEPNSTNPIHNYTYKSNKLCNITGKLNYYMETFDNLKKKKTLRGTMAKMFLLGAGTCGPELYSFSLASDHPCSAQADLSANRVSFFGEGFEFRLSCTKPKQLQWPWAILVYLSLRHILI